MKIRRINIKRLILSIMIISFIIYFGYNFSIYLAEHSFFLGYGQKASANFEHQYDIIKEDFNENYLGKRTRKDK